MPEPTFKSVTQILDNRKLTQENILRKILFTVLNQYIIIVKPWFDFLYFNTFFSNKGEGQNLIYKIFNIKEGECSKQFKTTVVRMTKSQFQDNFGHLKKLNIPPPLPLPFFDKQLLLKIRQIVRYTVTDPESGYVVDVTYEVINKSAILFFIKKIAINCNCTDIPSMSKYNEF